MSHDESSLLRRQLETERKARAILEKEVEERTRKLFLAYEHHQKIFESVGVAIVHVDSMGKLIKANRHAHVILFEQNCVQVGDDILPSLRHDGFAVKHEDLSTMINRDLELNYITPSGEVVVVGARFTSLGGVAANSDYLLTMKDMREIRRKEEEIKELQNKLVDSAFRDGVAENAVAVLHNIGNMLTAIMGRVSDEALLSDCRVLSTVLRKIHTSTGADDEKRFKDFVANDPKAIALPRMLGELAKTASGTEAMVAELFESVRENCQNISSVISAQQNYANYRERTKGVFEVRKLLGDCFTMNRNRMTSRGIELEIREFPFVQVYMEKIGLVQVLNNALTNAIEAIDERSAIDPTYTSKVISVEAKMVPNFLEISISDNGVGIAPEALKSLFKFGYSTKNRSSGFGLHNCANFMLSNGGRIEILSAGRNLGATTRLYCPFGGHPLA